MLLYLEDILAASHAVDNLHGSSMMMTTTCQTDSISQMKLENIFKHRRVTKTCIASQMNRPATLCRIRGIKLDLMDMTTSEQTRLLPGYAAKSEQMRHVDALFSERRRVALINQADGEIQAEMCLC